MVAAELALGVSEPGTVFKTITATLNLYDVSLRYEYRARVYQLLEANIG